MKIYNKKAKFEYALTGEGFEAGISLLGIEAKALGEGRGDLSNSFIKITDGEAFLINANIPAKGIKNYDPLRSRKLLLHKGEILSILTKSRQQNLQIVPVSIYNKGGKNGRKSRLIKVYLELGKGKRKFEKKESIKRKDIDRNTEIEAKLG